MKTPSIRILLATAAPFVFVVHAHAQQMKPGLWEVTTKMVLPPDQQALMEKTNASMRKMAETMPPDKKAQILAGLEANTKGTVSRACLTEAAAKADRPPGTAPASCKFDTQRSGDTMKTAWDCESPKTKGSGVYKFTGGGTGYTSETTSTVGNTKVSAQATGKWLGSDCKDAPLAGQVPSR